MKIFKFLSSYGVVVLTLELIFKFESWILFFGTLHKRKDFSCPVVMMQAIIIHAFNIHYGPFSFNQGKFISNLESFTSLNGSRFYFLFEKVKF